MAKIINYVGTCMQGSVRSNNEDNFWCDGIFLPADNCGMDRLFSGSRIIGNDASVFAVFDGMGGEARGEEAAYLAADCVDDYCRELPSMTEELLKSLYDKMNDLVCDFAKENKISSMGSTAVILVISDGCILESNIGDSKLYRYSDNTFVQVSEDHTAFSMFRKAPLTQFLGIPKEEFVIEPMIRAEKNLQDECFLLCTDGVSDMVSESELGELLGSNQSLEEKGKLLCQMIDERGAKDNYTFMLVEVN